MGRLQYEQTRNVRDREDWRYAAEEQTFRESVHALELAVRLRRGQEPRAGFSRGSEGDDFLGETDRLHSLLTPSEQGTKHRRRGYPGRYSSNRSSPLSG